MTNGGALASVVVVLGLVLAACGGQGPIAVAAEAICDAIDAEPSDEIAYAEFERAVARERRDGLDEGELRAAVGERCGRAITAISAAALAADEPEPEPELEPEPEPEPVFVDLASLDWEGESWSTDCTPEGERRDLSLTPEAGLGAVHRPAEGFTPVYVVDLDGAVFGDVTGDGHRDAVFVTKCVFAYPEVFVEVWSHDDNGQPRHLAPVHHFSKFEAVVDHVEAVGGKLRIHSREGAVGDDVPHLNGYPIEVVTDWTFDGKSWTSGEVSRLDTTPAPEPPAEPEPEPAPEPEPQPEPEPAPGACDQLGGFHHLGDEECAELLREIEECYQRYEADPDWVPYLDSLFENLITGEVAACDI